MKNLTEPELSKNEVSFMRDKGQEEKKPPKGEDTQNEETKLSYLESRTHSFVALVAKLEVVKIPDFLENWLFELADLKHFSFQKSGYSAHFPKENKSQEISRDLSRHHRYMFTEKSQEPGQSGKKFPEFDFYRQFKKKSPEFRKSQSQDFMRAPLFEIAVSLLFKVNGKKVGMCGRAVLNGSRSLLTLRQQSAFILIIQN